MVDDGKRWLIRVCTRFFTRYWSRTGGYKQQVPANLRLGILICITIKSGDHLPFGIARPATAAMAGWPWYTYCVINAFLAGGFNFLIFPSLTDMFPKMACSPKPRSFLKRTRGCQFGSVGKMPHDWYLQWLVKLLLLGQWVQKCSGKCAAKTSKRWLFQWVPGDFPLMQYQMLSELFEFRKAIRSLSTKCLGSLRHSYYAFNAIPNKYVRAAKLRQIIGARPWKTCLLGNLQ